MILKQNAPSTQDTQIWYDEFIEMTQKGKITKIIYNHMRGKSALDNSILRILWNNDLKLTLQQKQFEKIFIMYKKITTSTKLRYFQYRILVRALVLNIHVSKWNKEVSQLCSFCDEYNETTIHLFVECTHVKKIWRAMKKWCKYIYQIDISLTPSDIILNNFKGPHKELINIMILIIKFYVYRARVQREPLKFTNVITEINKIRNIEKTIAVMQNRLNAFQYKWVQYN